MNKQKLKGFTLLELVIVIAIIAILSAIIVPNMSDYIRTNHIISANDQAQQVFNAAQEYLVSEQLKGRKSSDIADDGLGNVPDICYLVVDTEIGNDSSQFDTTNKTTVAVTSGIKSDYKTKAIGSKTSYPIADGIEARLEPGFNGSWAVAFYPKTFTVAYAVFCDTYSTAAENEAAVKLIGTNNNAGASGCKNRLYKNQFTYSTAKFSQEQDFKSPDSAEAKHLYTGQYPVPLT